MPELIHTPPMEEISADQRGRADLLLIIVKCTWTSKGVRRIFSMGEMYVGDIQEGKRGSGLIDSGGGGC